MTPRDLVDLARPNNCSDIYKNRYDSAERESVIMLGYWGEDIRRRARRVPSRLCLISDPLTEYSECNTTGLPGYRHLTSTLRH